MANNFLEFFGLTENPFKITPDVDYFFSSKSHKEALMALEYLYESEEGFIVIIGEPGTGKTITIRKFLSNVPENMEYAYILFPNLSPQELLYAILEDFGVEIPSNVTKNKLFSILKDFLIEKKKEGKKVFIIVDEAQNLPVDTLEELRILSNLETDKEKLLQIVLIGQPELEEKLELPKLRQLKQRITIFVRLSHLDEDEVENYINFRLSKSGNTSIRVDKKAVKLIYKESKGIPRLINQIMERALMAAFLDRQTVITEKHVKRAVESLKLKNKKKRNFVKIPARLAFIVLLAGVLTFGLYAIVVNSSYESYKSIINHSEKLSFSKVDKTNSNEERTVNNNNELKVILMNENKKVDENTKENTNNSKSKVKPKFIAYFAATTSLEEARKIKEDYEKISGEKFYILRVKNGKYYSVATLYDDKKEGLKKFKRLKELLGDDDAFMTGRKYIPEIVE